MYYLGLALLSILVIQMLVFLIDQWRKNRLVYKNLHLRNNLLEQQVNSIIEQATTQESKEEVQEIVGWRGWRKFRVSHVKQENDSINSFYLVPHDGKSLPSYQPGQHLTFRLKVPGHSKPVVRCYSLSDDAGESDYYRVSIKKQSAPKDSEQDTPDGVSSGYFHQSLEVQDILDVRAPAGKFYLDLTERAPVILVAGGIGLTPSLSMLNTLHTRENDGEPGRKVWLFYGVRNAADLIMREHLETLAQEMTNLKVHYFFSKSDQEEHNGNLHSGYVSADKMRELGAPIDGDFYVCGPPPMMDSVVRGLSDLGVSNERIHFESFGPASISAPVGAKASAAVEKEGSFKMEFSSSQKVIDWNNSSGTILESAESAGVALEHGCRSGSCGTCSIAVLEGDVDYLHEPSIEVEQGSCLVCIAIPKSDLKIGA